MCDNLSNGGNVMPIYLSKLCRKCVVKIPVGPFLILLHFQIDLKKYSMKRNGKGQSTVLRRGVRMRCSAFTKNYPFMD